MYGRKTRTGGRPAGATSRVGESLEQEVEVTLEEAYAGGAREFAIDVPDGRGGSRREHIEVKIPAGVREGTKLRVAGKGHPGLGSAPRGDLYLPGQIKPHPTFGRRGGGLLNRA